MRRNGARDACNMFGLRNWRDGVTISRSKEGRNGTCWGGGRKGCAGFEVPEVHEGALTTVLTFGAEPHFQ